MRDFEKYLIPETPVMEGFLGELNRIPFSEIQRSNSLQVIQEIEALEAYTDAVISNLHSDIAMESSGSEDKLSSIAAKAKMAGQKMKEGKKRNDQNMISQGSNELSASMKELTNETKNAKDPKSKAKVWMVAKVIGAIVASILLIFGAVSAGKALSSGVKSNNIKDFSAGSKTAAQRIKSDPVVTSKKGPERVSAQQQMEEFNRQHEEILKQQAINNVNLDKLIYDMEHTVDAVQNLQRSVNAAKAAGVPDHEILKTKDGVDTYFTDKSKKIPKNHVFSVRMKDGTIKKMGLDAAMKSGGKLIL